MKTSDSVSDLLFPNQYRQKVLGLLLMKPGHWIHLPELARMTGAALGILKKGVDVLCRVELLALIKKTIGLADMQKLGLLLLEDKIRAAFVFGSMASASENTNSDIDLRLLDTPHLQM